MEKTIKTLDGKTIELAKTIDFHLFEEVEELIKSALALDFMIKIQPTRVIGNRFEDEPRYVMGLYRKEPLENK